MSSIKNDGLKYENMRVFVCMEGNVMLKEWTVFYRREGEWGDFES